MNEAFRLVAGCSRANFSSLNIAYRQGYYAKPAGGYAYQIGIYATSCELDCRVHVDSCRFENFCNIWYNDQYIKELQFTNCTIIAKHGFASCVWDNNTSSHPAQVILGAGEITVIDNCYFDGLQDSTFTNVVGSPPVIARTPLDGLFLNGGNNPLIQAVTNCTILNYGIEAVFCIGIDPKGAYFPNASLNKSVTSLTSVNSGNAAWPKLVTATCNAHGYSVGDMVTISGVTGGSDASYNGHHVIQTVATNTFTYLTKSVASATASGTIIANVNKISTRRSAYVLNNYFRGPNVKSQYYSGALLAAKADDVAGENIVFAGNNIVNGLNGIAGQVNHPWPSGTEVFYPQVYNNYISDCLYPINFVQPSSGTSIKNNSIRTSSRWAKQQVTWSKNPNSYCFHQPLALVGPIGDIVIEGNFIYQEQPLWDATVTVTARNSGSNSFTLSNASAIANNLRPLDNAGNQDYGALVAYSANKYEIYPITGVAGNDVTIEASYFVNQTAFSTGTAYWARSSYEDAHSSAAYDRGAIIGINSSNGDVVVKNNSIYNADIDFFTQGGTWKLTNNALFDARQYWTSDVQRIGPELRDSKLLYNGLEFSKGTGAPSSAADNGSLYIRTDGDASTSLYVRASGAWSPLSSWNP